MAVLSKLRESIDKFALVTAESRGVNSNVTNLNLWGILRHVMPLLLLVLLVFHIYHHSREGPFVFDDLTNILDNPHIRITTLDWESLKNAAFKSPLPSRWVVNISFALNYYFHQYSPEGYRLVNVIIHLCNGFLLYFFLKSTLQTPVLISRYRKFSFSIPFFAAAIWLVNPIHTQSVSYIVQRMNSMATMFYLLSILLYARSRLQGPNSRYCWPMLGGSIAAFILALGSKENSVTLPFFIFLYEWYFFRNLSLTWLKRNSCWLGVLVLFFVCMAFLYIDGNPLEGILYGYKSRDFTFSQRLLTQSRVVIFYIFLFIFPHPSRLNLDHHFPLSLSVLDPPTTLLSILALICLLAGAVFMARRIPLLSFSIMWFLGNLVIESSVIGLEIVFEHRTYLPTILFSLVLVMAIYGIIENRWARRAVLLLVVMMGALWTHDRNLIWGDDIALWSDTKEKSPAKVRPYVNLGIAHKDRGQFDKAISYLNRAVRLDPNYTKARYNLSLSLLSKGDFPQAEKHAVVAQKLDPKDSDAANALGIAMARQGRLEEAISSFSRALRLNPHSPDTHYNLSVALANAGQEAKAEMYCSEALRLKPDYMAARMHLRELRKRRVKMHSPPSKIPSSKNISIKR